jgi:hypothetical protein
MNQPNNEQPEELSLDNLSPKARTIVREYGTVKQFREAIKAGEATGASADLDGDGEVNALFDGLHAYNAGVPMDAESAREEGITLPDGDTQEYVPPEDSPHSEGTTVSSGGSVTDTADDLELSEYTLPLAAGGAALVLAYWVSDR